MVRQFQRSRGRSPSPILQPLKRELLRNISISTNTIHNDEVILWNPVNNNINLVTTYNTRHYRTILNLNTPSNELLSIIEKKESDL